jgi:hypothetical protein
VKRHCSICHLPGHDRRAHARRNPESAQLDAQVNRTTGRWLAAGAAGRHRGIAHWQKQLDKEEDVIAEQPPQPTQRFFMAHGHPVPVRLALEAKDRYHNKREANERLGARYRREERTQKREETARRRAEERHAKAVDREYRAEIERLEKAGDKRGANQIAREYFGAASANAKLTKRVGSAVARIARATEKRKATLAANKASAGGSRPTTKRGEIAAANRRIREGKKLAAESRKRKGAKA